MLEEHGRGETVLFGLSDELGELGKLVVDHDDETFAFCFAVGDENPSRLVSLEKLVVKPDAGAIARTDFLVVVEQVYQVPCNS